MKKEYGFKKKYNINLDTYKKKKEKRSHESG